MKYLPKTETTLDDRIERYMAKCPCPHSERHSWLKETAPKLHTQFPELNAEQIAEVLRAHLTRPEKHHGTECQSIAQWVVGQKSNAVKRRPNDAARRIRFASKPEPVMIADKGAGGDVEDMRRFIEHIFKPDEYVYLSGGMSHDKFHGKGMQVWDIADLLMNHPDAEEMLGRRDDGLYVKVNPINAKWRTQKSEEPRNAPAARWTRKNGSQGSDLTDMRNCLVEFDVGSIEDQIKVIEHAGLPVRAMCLSGDKSVHAIVAIDAGADYDLFQKRAALVVEATKYAAQALGFEDIKIDKVQDAVRWTRFAGALRKCDKHGNPLGDDGEGVQQKLLALCDAEWEEPEEIDEYAEALMARAASHAEIYVNTINEPRAIIEGFLRPGDVASLTASSKIGKTFELIRMASAIASGGEWMGMQCRAHNVVYLNFELHDFDMHKRMRRLLKDNPQAQKRIMPFNLRGIKGDAETMLSKFEDLVAKGRINASIFIIDPLYRFLGDADENSNTDITNLLLRIQKFATNTGMAVFFAHHHAKGKNRADTMSSGEQQSGAGAFTRTYDANINLGRIPSELKDTFNPDEYMIIQFDIRAFPRKPYLIAQWDDEECGFKALEQSEVDRMQAQTEAEKPNKKTVRAEKKRDERRSDVLNYLYANGEIDLKEASQIMNKSEKAARIEMNRMEDDGLVEFRTGKQGKKIWFLDK